MSIAALVTLLVPASGLSIPASDRGVSSAPTLPGLQSHAVLTAPSKAEYLAAQAFTPELSARDFELASRDFNLASISSAAGSLSPSSFVEFSRGTSSSGFTQTFNQQLRALVHSEAVYAIYFGTIMTVVLLTVLIFWTRGLLVCFSIIVYLLSLATMTLTVKAVYVNNAYSFPKFVSALHFMLSGLACFGYLAYQHFRYGARIRPPTLNQATLIVPVSFFFAVSIGASNSALVYSNAGFVEMVASCGPLSTAIVCLALGMGFDTRLVCPVLCVTAGMALCATGELQFSWMGFLFALVSTFTRSTRSALQQKLLSTECVRDALNPVELLAWMSIPSSVWMLCWSFFSEGLEPYPPLVGPRGLSISLAVALTCVNAVCLNLSQNFVLQQLGAVGTIIAGNLKGVLLLLGAVAIFGDVITPTQLTGFSVEMAGIFWYNRADQEVRASIEEKERLAEKVSLRKASKESCASKASKGSSVKRLNDARV